MRDAATGKDGEVLFAGLGFYELFGDIIDGFFRRAGVVDFDIDLLDLKISDSASVIGVYEHGLVEVDIVEVDWAFDSVEDANDHEFLT